MELTLVLVSTVIIIAAIFFVVVFLVIYIGETFDGKRAALKNHHLNDEEFVRHISSCNRFEFNAALKERIKAKKRVEEALKVLKVNSNEEKEDIIDLQLDFEDVEEEYNELCAGSFYI